MKADPTDIRGEQARLALSEEERRKKRLLELSDLTVVMRSPEGRRVVWQAMAFAGIYRSSFDNSGSVTAWNEGRRSVGLYLLQQLTGSKELFDLWGLAQKEQMSDGRDAELR